MLYSPCFNVICKNHIEIVYNRLGHHLVGTKCQENNWKITFTLVQINRAVALSGQIMVELMDPN